jgi:hypothetical protein
MFNIKVEGVESFDIPPECIRKVSFSTDIPLNSDARTADVSTTILVTGRILTAVDGDPFDSTRKLALWSAIPATNAACYRNVTVKNVRGGIVERNYSYPNACVVDYDETFGDTEGVGTFVLKKKKKKDLLDRVKIEGGFSSDE